MSRSDRRRWRAPQSVTELGHMMAAWLEGEIRSRPGYSPSCGPEEETAHLVPTLAALCRRGFVTTSSQPGLATTGFDGRWWGMEDRQTRKHPWTPPGSGRESLACGVKRRATAFVDGLADVVAFTHHTAILALRAVLERRPVTELVDEARMRKTPNDAVLVYGQADGLFHACGTIQPDC
ncbi:DUF6919 domain-containing protein [Streptomyces niveus]|uniref:DUF6919 domain-containing protein n=1 Tax=Streptomyces niveus TaxID=193462 RepID=UPI00362FBA15